MKKLTSTLLLLIILTSATVKAQNCDLCNTTDTIATYGFINMDSIPCIVPGVTYDFAIPVKMFPTFTTAGTTVNVDSVKFVNFGNLPCGICWSANKASATYVAGENGCIRITGITNDSSGQYKIAITLTAWINHLKSGIPTPPPTVDAAGIKMYIRVQPSVGNCLAVDTASAAPTNITNPSRCITGVNDLAGYISTFDVFPNPTNTDAVISFNALQSGMYEMKVTDVAGKTIRLSETQAVTGDNRVILKRQGLPAGIYFVSISNHAGLRTAKMVVTE